MLPDLNSCALKRVHIGELRENIVSAVIQQSKMPGPTVLCTTPPAVIHRNPDAQHTAHLPWAHSGRWPGQATLSKALWV